MSDKLLAMLNAVVLNKFVNRQCLKLKKTKITGKNAYYYVINTSTKLMYQNCKCMTAFQHQSFCKLQLELCSGFVLLNSETDVYMCTKLVNIILICLCRNVLPSSCRKISILGLWSLSHDLYKILIPTLFSSLTNLSSTATLTDCHTEKHRRWYENTSLVKYFNKYSNFFMYQVVTSV